MVSVLALSIYLQAGLGWRLDFLSLLIGLIIGVGLTVAFYRYLPAALAWRDQLVSRARETRAWVRSGVETRYQVETADYVATYHLGGAQASLEQIFVPPLIVAPQSPIEPDFSFQPSPRWLQYLWPSLVNKVAVDPPPTIPVRQLLLQGRRVVISAELGAGKTTLLAYCALACANASEMGPYTPLLPMVPVFVHLAELDYLIAPSDDETPAPDPNPLTPLSQVMQHRTSVLTGRGTADLFRQKANSGHLLLLLDGWDDLPPESRPDATDWLHRLLIAYPDVQVIMAGPERGYGPLVELDFAVVGLLPWRVGDVERFEEQWRQVLDEQMRLPLPIFWQPGQLPLETTFRLLLGMTERPNDRSQTPQRWIELMETLLRERLPRFDDTSDPDWLAPVTRELWQKLAYRLVSERRLYLPRLEVESLIDAALVDYEAQEDRGSAQRLFNTLKSSGIFVLWHDQRIGMYSSVWRDFLAANHVALFQLKDEVMDHLADPVWAGVVRFYIGRVGATEAAEMLLAGKQTDPLSENLFQVASWLPEAPDKGEWRRQLLIQIGQLVVKGNLPIALRQRAALSLAGTGESGVLAFLRQLLSQQEPTLRQVAVAAIARLGAEITLEVAEKMFQDGLPQVRASAVYVLTWLNDPVVEKLLLTALVEPDEPMNRAAAEGLALNGSATAFDILREAAIDEALYTRRAAVYGLARLNDYWAVELLDLMEREDEQWLVKSAAGSALETIVERNKLGRWEPFQPGNQAWLIEWAARQERAVPAGAG
ncbi:MAG: HEAT repeat domain-containing protein, partial [Candidatus Promineifilaceae bacterium]